MGKFKDTLKNIKAFVFDVDGVWTNGFIYVDGNGLQMRTTNVKDGYAIHYASKLGYPVAIITGGKCKSIIGRFNDLGVKDVYIEASNKVEYFEQFLEKYNLKAKEVMYMGDDLPDYRVMMIDPDYQYALIGSKSAKYLWILSRTPQLKDNVKEAILAEATRRGYDVSQLIWVKQ